jgi:hypothetical protein
MPKDQDTKRLIRQRMEKTGERYTTARAEVLRTFAARDDQRIEEWLVGLADPERTDSSFRALEALPPEERLAVALRGASSDSWRVRRRSCQLLDDLSLTTQTQEALERCATDPHPRVRQAALHSLGCETCKPDGCALDMADVYRRALRDPSAAVRKGVVGVLGWKFTADWAKAMLEDVAADDPSAKLRALAAAGLAGMAQRRDADARRRALPPDLLTKTERHPGRWIAVRDGRIVAAGKGVAPGRPSHRGDDLYFHIGDGTFRF